MVEQSPNPKPLINDPMNSFLPSLDFWILVTWVKFVLQVNKFEWLARGVSLYQRLSEAFSLGSYYSILVEGSSVLEL